MRRVLSYAYWIYFALSLIPLFSVALTLWLVTLPFDRNGRVLHLYSSLWAAHYIYLNPLWRLRMEGVGGVSRQRPWVIVSNHQSLLDILVLFATYLPYKWVSKEAVFRAPFLGWNMRLNRYVPLRRGDRTSVGEMAAQCLGWLRRGVSVLIFPEGTRSSDGMLLPFKVGAFRMAREAGVAVLPIVLDGTSSALPKHGLTFSARAEFRVRVLAPMDLSGLGSDEEAAAVVKSRMEQALAELRS